MRVIYTAGVWDLLHTGHIRFLQASRALGDRLIVGVVSDDGAAAYKRRPIISEHDRFAMVNALSCVDIAVRQPGTDPTPVLDMLVGDMGIPIVAMTHGDDWSELREGNKTLERYGIRLVLLPYGSGKGTTGIIHEIRTREGV